VYTSASKSSLIGMSNAALAEVRAATEAHALHLARAAKERLEAGWGIGETGAAGPTGNRYGDPAGHSAIALDGPTSCALTLRTGSADRVANMDAFARRALELLAEALSTN
ncbi:MAG: CinA family protein, partial [Acetobacteraceae bacterium]